MRCPTLAELPPAPSGKVGWPWTEGSPRLPSLFPFGERWPRVSIVTPSYNQGEFLEETIRSVLLQGYPDLEYVVMDGGSTDDSVQIIRRYERWIGFWVSERDGGQSQAINDGWARATGQILAYVNSDDSYLAGAVISAVRAFHRRPGAGMVYGSAVVVDEAGRELRRWDARPFSLRAMLVEGNVVPQTGAFYSRQALEAVGYLEQQLHMIMDYELSIRVGIRFPSVCIPDTLARFRDHTRSKSRIQFARTASELIRFVDQLDADGLSAGELRVLKKRTLSRIHYEWAMACIAQGEDHGATARHLQQSLRLHPLHALRRPIQTSYIVKEIIRQRFLVHGR